jgi:hypothetical protein
VGQVAHELAAFHRGALGGHRLLAIERDLWGYRFKCECGTAGELQRSVNGAWSAWCEHTGNLQAPAIPSVLREMLVR